MVVAVQQPSAECTTIYAVCIVNVLLSRVVPSVSSSGLHTSIDVLS